ncbi:MAG: flagellar hook-associated protein FlgL [Thioalkalispiraceae bacterium]|jgi:flagellar hook-associated protein 3 FlgL
MRLSTYYSHQIGINGILDQQSRLSHTQEQLASGKRVLKPSDDPISSATSLSLDKTVTRNEQFQKNITFAKNRLTIEEGVLANASDILQRVRELAVRGVNDSLGADSRAGIANEIYELKEEMISLANTRDASDNFLFGGFQAKQIPFVEGPPGVFSYQGDQGQRQVQIGDSRYVDIGDSGYDVFWRIPDSETAPVNYQSVFQTIQDLADNMNSNTPDTADIEKIDLALNNIVEARARVGARLNTIDRQENINDNQIYESQVALSDLRDLDYAEAISRMNIQLTALEAAQQSYTRVQGLSLFNFL